MIKYATNEELNKDTKENNKKIENYQNNTFIKKVNPIYTFENFIVGKSNKLAYYSAFAVANFKETNKAMPLFIYGPVGVGKTHLVNAIFNYINTNFTNKKVLYTSGQEFIYEFVKALQNRKILEFKTKFQNINILIIDDLQLIASAVNSQVEFLNIIDNLIQDGKQIIVCADKSAYKLDNIQEQIKSRLGCGLVIEMDLPDYELRVEILKAKALERKIKLSNEVINFLAYNLITSVREIEGALNKILTYKKAYNNIIKVSDIKVILQDLINQNKKIICINEIINYTAQYFYIRVEDILSNHKCARFSKPRQIAIYAIKELTKENLKKIALIFNKKDHTSILYAIRNLNELKKQDSKIEKDIVNIINYFKY
ncbi:MAG: chromosomal replication initiator protein DnaA [Rickettsiales bacterium]